MNQQMSAREVIARATAARTNPYRARPWAEIDPHSQALYRKDADAVIFALAAAGYVIERDWQPIATAPKDDTEILVLGGTAYWHRGRRAWWSVAAQRPIEWHVLVWRPLPQPPAQMAGAGEEGGT